MKREGRKTRRSRIVPVYEWTGTSGLFAPPPLNSSSPSNKRPHFRIHLPIYASLSLSLALHLSPLYFSRLFANYPSIHRVATSRLVSASFHFPMERFFIATRATFPLRGTVFTNNRLERGRSNGLASWRLRSVVVGGTKTVSARRPLSWSC